MYFAHSCCRAVGDFVVHKQSRAILGLFLVVLVSGIGPAVLAHGGGGVSVATPTPTEAPEEEQQPEREGEAPPEGGGTAEPEEETGTEGEPGEGESGESFILDLVPFCEPYAATPRIESNTVIGNGRGSRRHMFVGRINCEGMSRLQSIDSRTLLSHLSFVLGRRFGTSSMPGGHLGHNGYCHLQERCGGGRPLWISRRGVTHCYDSM